MRSIQQSIASTIEKDRNYIIFKEIIVALVIVSYFLSLYYGFKYLYANPYFGTLHPGGGPLYTFINNTLPFISMIPWILLVKCFTYPYTLIDTLGQSAKGIEKLLKNEISNISNIDIILQHIKELRSILGKIITIKNIFGRIFTKETNVKIQKFLISISKEAISLLKNLYGDLQINLEKNLEVIKEAKASLSQNTNSESYNQTLILQSTRLEVQIKQFEELQKVLVKI